MNIRKHATAKGRRNALEKELGIQLSHTGAFTLDESVASSRNCENMIGATQVPIGIAGPLKLSVVSDQLSETDNQQSPANSYYIPLATTEGALVASINRGAKAITQSGGAYAHAASSGVTRAPVFRVSSISDTRSFIRFLGRNEATIRSIAEATSRHLKLKGHRVYPAGRYAHVRFSYDTQDAMGMNMVTIATSAVVEWIEKETGHLCVGLSGNMCVDKKPAWMNATEGRGRPASAEVELPEAVLSDVLKTTSQAMYETWLAKCMIGSAMAGSMGFNAQFANVIAALFLATGQDIAHVSEGSVGITTTEIVPGSAGGLHISVYLPDLMVGTVGGGTALSTQQEALAILAAGQNTEHLKASQLACIVAATVLAGEISLLASLSEGTLASAHKKLGRGEK